MQAFNLKDIQAAQDKNDALLGPFKALGTKGFACLSTPVENMAWLGAGGFAAPGCDVLDRHGRPLQGNLINNAIHFPTFQKLERPATLKSKCQIVASTKEDQELVHQIWNNENLLFSIACHETVGEPFIYCVFASGADTDNPQEIFLYKGYTRTRDGEPPGTIRTPKESILNRLEGDDEHILKFRVVHSFLRVLAYALPVHNVRELCCFMEIKSHLTPRKYKADFLDWKILSADLFLNLPSPQVDHNRPLPEKLQRYLQDVAVALEAMDRFAEAAPLLLEIAEALSEEVVGNHFGFYAPQSFFLAAKALYMEGKLDAALECTVRHMEVVSRNDPSLDMRMYETYWKFFMATNISKLVKSVQGQQGSQWLQLTRGDTEALGAVALISAALPKSCQDDFLPISMPADTDPSHFLKKKFQRRGYALGALVRLMPSKSFDEYKNVFYGCVDPKKLSYLRPNTNIPNPEELHQKYRDIEKNSARGLIQEKAISNTCTRCRKMGATFKCPCNWPHYCSKKCQIEDWAYHKTKCSYHKQKQWKKEREAKQSQETPKGK